MLIMIGWIFTGIGIILLALTMISGKKKNIKGKMEELQMITSSGFAYTDINEKRKTQQRKNIYREKAMNEDALPMRRRAVSESARELLQEVKSEVAEESKHKTNPKHVISRILVEEDNDDTDILSTDSNDEYLDIPEMPDLPETFHKENKEDDNATDILSTDILSDDERTDILGTGLLRNPVNKKDKDQKDQTDILNKDALSEDAKTDILETEVLKAASNEQTELLQAESYEMNEINTNKTDILPDVEAQEKNDQTEYLGNIESVQTESGEEEQTAILQTDVLNSGHSKKRTITINEEKTEILNTDEEEDFEDATDILRTAVLGTDILDGDPNKTDILSNDKANIDGGDELEETAILQ